MRIIPDSILVLSLEASCWETPQEQPSKQQNEIIEIGVLQLSLRNLTISEPISFFVKPITSKVSLFCTRITNITQPQVDNGFSFDVACQKLIDAGCQKLPYATFGDFDRFIFKHQCNQTKVPYPFKVGHWDFSTTFAKMMGLEHEVKLPIAMKLFGMDFIGVRHNSKDEAYNIARLMAATFNRVRGNNYGQVNTNTTNTTENKAKEEETTAHTS